MNKKDYIEGAVSKIFNIRKKKMVTAELELHIDEKTDFYTEIGYENEIAEQKASEAMGDSNEVAAQFGELHNDFYNPAADITLFAVLLALLAGVYYMLKQYVFIDVGLISLTISAFFLAPAVMYGYCALSLFKNKLATIILSVFVIGASGIFNYFMLSELYKRFGGRLYDLIDFVLKTKVPSQTSYLNKERIIAIICIISAGAVLICAFSLIYYIKVKSLSNRKIDNKLMHFCTKISLALTVLFLVLCIVFGIKTYFDLTKIRNEFYETYDCLIELSEKCSTKDEIIDFVNNSSIPFEEERNKDGELLGYSYIRNLVYIDITFNKTKSMEQIREETMKYLTEEYGDNIRDLVGKSALTEMVLEVTKEKLLEHVDDSIRNTYESQVFCKIIMGTNINSFNNSYDRLSTSFLLRNGEEEKVFRKYENNQLDHTQKYDFYKNLCPTRLEIEYNFAEIDSCKCSFRYLFGEGQYTHEEIFSACRMDEKTQAFYDNIDDIVNRVKENRNMSTDEIAQLTGADVVMPEVTKEELEKQMSVLGTKFKEYKERALASYEDNIKFVFDDWSFNFKGKPYEVIYIYNRVGKLIYTKNLNDGSLFINYDSKDDGQKKVRIDGGYFDKLGKFYSQPEHTPYYTLNGDKYYYYIKTIKDETHTVGDTKEYYLTDRKNKFYKSENCFIDKDGYLCVNLQNLKYDEATGKYKSPNGNEYTKAFETSWDKNGYPIMQSDENESTFSFLN